MMLGIAGAALAQDPEPVEPKKWAIRLGGFVPTQGTLRNQSGSPYYMVAFDYYPNLRYKPLGGDIYLNVDFKWRESGGQGFMTIPVAANVKWNITPDTSDYRVWGGLGAGIYFINTAFIGGTTQPGARFFLGGDITDKWFLEVDYEWVGGFTDGRGNGLRTDGVTFSVGRRF